MLHMLANKPLSENIQSKNFIFSYFLIISDEQEKIDLSKKKHKKGKKN